MNDSRPLPREDSPLDALRRVQLRYKNGLCSTASYAEDIESAVDRLLIGLLGEGWDLGE